MLLRRFVPVLVLLSGCAAPAVSRFDDARRAREAPEAVRPDDSTLAASFTLEQAVALARANNPTLHEARSRVEAARAEISMRGSLMEPRLQFEAGPVSWEHPLSLRSSMSMAGVRQMIPFPGKLELDARAAEAEALATLEESLERENDVVAEVERAYYDAWLAVEELAVDEGHDRLLDSILSVAQAHYRAGRAPVTDVLKIQAARIRIRNEMVFVRRRVGVSKLVLNVLMGREPGAALADPQEAAPREIAESQAALQALAAEARPRVQASRHAVEGAERSRELATRNAWLPDFELGLDYVRQPMEERDSWRGMLMLNLPFLSAGRPAAVRRAESVAEARQASFRSEQLMAAREAGEAFLAVRATRESLALSRDELLPLARQTLELLQSNYANNAASFIDLLDAERALLDAELGTHRAEAEYGKAVVELERAVGGSLDGNR